MTEFNTMLRNCIWGYRCDQQWENLVPTSDLQVRFCQQCQRSVHSVNNRKELAEQVLLNHCVAFSSQLLQPEKLDNVISVGQIYSEYLINE